MMGGPAQRSTSIAADDAQAALDRVIKGIPRELDQELLGQVFAERDAEYERAPTHVTCPACHQARIHRVKEVEDVFACDYHPAHLRLHATIAALNHALEVCEALGLDASGVNEAYFAADPWMRKAIEHKTRAVPKRGWHERNALDYFMPAPAYLPRGRKEHEPIIRKLSTEVLVASLLEWRRIYHRDEDPCPLCGEVVALEAFPEHALGCKAHPANVPRDMGRAALRRALGEGGATELEQFIADVCGPEDTYRALVRACERFSGEMGWNGEHAYSRPDDEKPWLQAVARARNAIGMPETRARPRPPGELMESWPEGTWRVRDALIRLLAAQFDADPKLTDEEQAVLRGAAAELVSLAQKYGESTTCPACGRAGLSVFDAASHISTCVRHPAEARARGLAAQVRVLGSSARAMRPDLAAASIPPASAPAFLPFRLAGSEEEARLGPRSFGLRFIKEDLDCLDFLLDPLQRAREPARISAYGERVVRVLDKWQRYHSAAVSTCPACGKGHDLAELRAHVMRCKAHPAVERIRQLAPEAKRLAAGRFFTFHEDQVAADVGLVRVAMLIDHCEALWSRASDGERGRSVYGDEAVQAWDRAWREAKDALVSFHGWDVGPLYDEEELEAQEAEKKRAAKWWQFWKK